ncbi:hypothetical protein D3C86_2177440 [compost metagenome]
MQGAPGVLRGLRVPPPATVDDAQFFRGDAQQGFVEDVVEFLGLPAGRQGEGGLLGADGGTDL